MVITIITELACTCSPQRVRVIRPTDYDSDVDQLLSADAAFLEALSQCIEAEDLCPLSTVNSTALELQTTLWDLAEQIRLSPIAVDTVIIDYSVVVNIYYLSIKYPAVFPLTAQLILDILTRQNLDDVVGNYTLIYGSLAAGNPESIYGILGGDKFPRYSSLVDVLPDIEYAAQTSPRFWGLIAPFSMLTAQWPFVAKERYDGDFKVKTKNPMLFVGNTWDPATPIASARNMSATFEGSVLFEQHGIGVSFMAFVLLSHDPSSDPNGSEALDWGKC